MNVLVAEIALSDNDRTVIEKKLEIRLTGTYGENNEKVVSQQV